MTVPMVAWMHYRGHAWRPNAEMAAAMLIPAAAAVGISRAAVVTDGSMLMVLEHAAMLAAMFAAMLLRRDEYSCAAHSGRRAAVAA
jgi:hypothetical protein